MALALVSACLMTLNIFNPQTPPQPIPCPSADVCHGQTMVHFPVKRGWTSIHRAQHTHYKESLMVGWPYTNIMPPNVPLHIPYHIPMFAASSHIFPSLNLWPGCLHPKRRLLWCHALWYLRSRGFSGRQRRGFVSKNDAGGLLACFLMILQLSWWFPTWLFDIEAIHIHTCHAGLQGF